MREPTAGSLRTRLTIVPWKDVSTGFADAVAEDGAPRYRWGNVSSVAAATYWGSQQIDTGVTHLILVRYLPEISSRHVIEAEGFRYRVRRVKHNSGPKRWTWLEFEQLGAS